MKNFAVSNIGTNILDLFIGNLLEASRQGPPLLAGKSLVLEVKPVEVASAYSGREFVYRQTDGTMTRDYYHGFFDLPETLLTETLRLWFSGEAMDRLRETEGDVADGEPF